MIIRSMNSDSSKGRSISIVVDMFVILQYASALGRVCIRHEVVLP